MSRQVTSRQVTSRPPGSLPCFRAEVPRADAAPLPPVLLHHTGRWRGLVRSVFFSSPVFPLAHVFLISWTWPRAFTRGAMTCQLQAVLQLCPQGGGAHGNTHESQ